MKSFLIMLGIAVVIYGVSLIVKTILVKTKHEKIWTDWIGKYWTLFVLMISSIVYCIISKDFINGLSKGLLLTGMQASIFKLIKLI